MLCLKPLRIAGISMDMRISSHAASNDDDPDDDPDDDDGSDESTIIMVVVDDDDNVVVQPLKEPILVINVFKAAKAALRTTSSASYIHLSAS